MVRNATFSTLIGSAGIFVLTLLCIASIYIYKQFVPAQVDSNTINIVDADVEHARALWESTNAHEYEYNLVIKEQAVDVTLHVNRDTGEYLLIKDSSGTLAAVPYNMASGTAGICCQLVSIDKLLDLTFDKIVEVNNGTKILPNLPNYDQYVDITVQFDPQLGYPTEITCYTRITRGNREVTWREPAQSIIIKDVKIVR
jgi:hypothetical protein